VVCLQRLVSVAKAVIYNEWISSIHADATVKELSKFDCIQKVDTENKIQLTLMYKNFRRSMPVVSFLDEQLRVPTDQFPIRRSPSAWNLTEGGQTRGFSGTDDTRFLLRLSVKQVPPDDLELRSTIVAMIDRFLECTQDVVALKDNGETPLGHEIVKRSLALGMLQVLWQALLTARLRHAWHRVHFVASSTTMSSGIPGLSMNSKASAGSH
jgi:hypothetical protein